MNSGSNPKNKKERIGSGRKAILIILAVLVVVALLCVAAYNRFVEKPELPPVETPDLPQETKPVGGEVTVPPEPVLNTRK